MSAQSQRVGLDAWTFDNRFARDLLTANSRQQVSGACYTHVLPRKAAQPQLVAYARWPEEKI